jgi:hypothetical protein
MAKEFSRLKIGTTLVLSKTINSKEKPKWFTKMETSFWGNSKIVISMEKEY